MSYDRMGKRNMQFVAGFTGITGLLFHAPLTSDLALLAGTGSDTFTRTGDQTYNDTGVLKIASGDDTPAFEKDASGNDLGISMWEASSNLGLHSGDSSNAVYTKTNITVSSGGASILDGATSDRLTSSAANGTIIQDLGTIASAAKTYNIYIKRVTGSGAIEITLDGGTAWTAVTGEINGSTFTRVAKTQTLADPDFGIRIVTNGDAIDVEGHQVEAKVISTPLIPTTTDAVTRNVTSLTYPLSGNVETPGTVMCVFTPGYEAVNPSGLFGVIGTRLNFNSGNGPNIYWDGRFGKIAGRYKTGSTLDGDIPSGNNAVSFNTRAHCAMAHDTDDLEVYLDGSSLGTDTATSQPLGTPGDTNILVGIANADQGGPSNGNIKHLRFYDSRLATADVVTLAASDT